MRERGLICEEYLGFIGLSSELVVKSGITSHNIKRCKHCRI